MLRARRHCLAGWPSPWHCQCKALEWSSVPRMMRSDGGQDGELGTAAVHCALLHDCLSSRPELPTSCHRRGLHGRAQGQHRCARMSNIAQCRRVFTP
eukprot:3937126-Rhodomonas_salina.7